MKKEWILVFTIACLLFFCACGGTSTKAEENVSPDPVETLPDARELWQKADEIVASWDNVDSDVSSVICMEWKGLKSTIVSESRIKGKGLLSDKPVYQAVTTGDIDSEVYFSEGWLYVSGDFGSYKQEASLEQAGEYLNQNAVELTQDSFEDVSLISQENGYVLAFSGPKEELRQSFLDGYEEQGILYKEGSFDAVGGLMMSEDGSLKSISVDISAVFTLDGEDVTMTAKSSQKILGHEERAISLPSKIQDYTEVKRILDVETVYEAFLSVMEATAVDFESCVDFDGEILGKASQRSERQRGYMQTDPATLDVRYFSEWSQWIGDEETEKTSIDYNGNKATVVTEDGTEEVDITEWDLLAALMSELYCYGMPTDIVWYGELKVEETGAGTRIDFLPNDALLLDLMDIFMYQNLDYSVYSDIVENTDYEVQNASGYLVLDNRGRLIEMNFDGDVRWQAANGSKVEGHLIYSKVINAYDEAVTARETEEGIQAA